MLRGGVAPTRSSSSTSDGRAAASPSSGAAPPGGALPSCRGTARGGRGAPTSPASLLYRRARRRAGPLLRSERALPARADRRQARIIEARAERGLAARGRGTVPAIEANRNLSPLTFAAGGPARRCRGKPPIAAVISRRRLHWGWHRRSSILRLCSSSDAAGSTKPSGRRRAALANQLATDTDRDDYAAVTGLAHAALARGLARRAPVGPVAAERRAPMGPASEPRSPTSSAKRDGRAFLAALRGGPELDSRTPSRSRSASGALRPCRRARARRATKSFVSSYRPISRTARAPWYSPPARAARSHRTRRAASGGSERPRGRCPRSSAASVPRAAPCRRTPMSRAGAA